MSWLIVACGTWVLAVGFFCVLARSAGMADAGRPEAPSSDLLLDTELELFGERPAAFTERRGGTVERRSRSRPWEAASLGRREDDAPRRAEEAERRLRRSRERLAEGEADTA